MSSEYQSGQLKPVAQAISRTSRVFSPTQAPAPYVAFGTHRARGRTPASGTSSTAETGEVADMQISEKPDIPPLSTRRVSMRSPMPLDSSESSGAGHLPIAAKYQTQPAQALDPVETVSVAWADWARKGQNENTALREGIVERDVAIQQYRRQLKALSVNARSHKIQLQNEVDGLQSIIEDLRAKLADAERTMVFQHDTVMQKITEEKLTSEHIARLELELQNEATKVHDYESYIRTTVESQQSHADELARAMEDAVGRADVAEQRVAALESQREKLENTVSSLKQGQEQLAELNKELGAAKAAADSALEAQRAAEAELMELREAAYRGESHADTLVVEMSADEASSLSSVPSVHLPSLDDHDNNELLRYSEADIEKVRRDTETTYEQRFAILRSKAEQVAAKPQKQVDSLKVVIQNMIAGLSATRYEFRDELRTVLGTIRPTPQTESRFRDLLTKWKDMIEYGERELQKRTTS